MACERPHIGWASEQTPIDLDDIYARSEHKYQTDRQTDFLLTEIKVITDLFVIVIREYHKINVVLSNDNIRSLVVGR